MKVSTNDETPHPRKGGGYDAGNAGLNPKVSPMVAIDRMFKALLGLAGGFMVGPIPLALAVAVWFLPVKRTQMSSPLLRWVVAAAGVGVLGAVLSATYNQAPTPMKTIGSFLSVGLLVVAYSRAAQRVDSIVRVFALTSVATIAAAYLLSADPRTNTVEGFWKYGAALPVTIVILYLFAQSGRFGHWQASPLVILGLISFALNFRSHGLICLVSAVMLISRRYSKRNTSGTNSKRRAGILAASVGLASLAYALPKAMTAGLLGIELQSRILAQTANSTPLLLGGRTEMPMSFAAINERPIIGWGDAQSVPSDVIGEGMHVASVLGMQDPGMYLGYWIRPGGVLSFHSILFTSWIEGGLLAAFLPILLISIFATSLYYARGPMAAIVIFASAQGIWDLIFSPWADNRLTLIALTAVLAIWTIRDAKAKAGEGRQGAPLPWLKRRLPEDGKLSTNRRHGFSSNAERPPHSGYPQEL